MDCGKVLGVLWRNSDETAIIIKNSNHHLTHSDLIKYLDCLNLSSWKNSNSFFLTWIRLNLFKIISASSRSNLRLFDFPFITKCVDFYYKVCQLFVLQSVLIFITKCVRSFITKCVDFYYKVCQVLQSASKCITKCGRYYKVWFLLQSEL